LIKRSVVAGAVAWTAPVIIDSLASPAAAATAPSGANDFTIGTNNCALSGYPATNALPSDCITPTTYSGGGPVTFSVTGGCACTFTAAIAQRTQGGTCISPSSSTATSMSFAALSGNQTFAGFKFVLTCG
jgi:hypothetical protein